MVILDHADLASSDPRRTDTSPVPSLNMIFRESHPPTSSVAIGNPLAGSSSRAAAILSSGMRNAPLICGLAPPPARAAMLAAWVEPISEQQPIRSVHGDAYLSSGRRQSELLRQALTRFLRRVAPAVAALSLHGGGVRMQRIWCVLHSNLWLPRRYQRAEQ